MDFDTNRVKTYITSVVLTFMGILSLQMAFMWSVVMSILKTATELLSEPPSSSPSLRKMATGKVLTKLLVHPPQFKGK